MDSNVEKKSGFLKRGASMTAAENVCTVGGIVVGAVGRTAGGAAHILLTFIHPVIYQAVGGALRLDNWQSMYHQHPQRTNRETGCRGGGWLLKPLGHPLVS